MDIIENVWTGKAGLARTYWLYGVAAGFAWGVPFATVTPGSYLAMAIGALFVVYLIVVNVGIWRAASRYEGPKVWGILAKAAVAAFPALLVVGTLLAIVVPAAHKSPEGVGVTNTPSAQPDWERGKFSPPASEIDAYLAAPPSIEEAKSWTQESTGSSENGPWLSHAPVGARFCRLADHTIVVLFPPGVRPNAERANVFCANSSVATHTELGFTYEEVAGKEAATNEWWKQDKPVDDEFWKKGSRPVAQPEAAPAPGLTPFNGKLDGQ